MTLWAVTMVRDELDILPYTLAHLETQGVSGVIAADNRSTDGTREWLHDHRHDHRFALEVLHDDEVAYYQARKMTTLVHLARRRGAEWVLPFDADEVWYSTQPGSTVADELVTATTPCVTARLHNYHPTSSDDRNEPNPFRRIHHRNPDPAPLPKVVVRAIEGIQLEQGNHGAHGPGVVCGPSNIAVAHFPWRSPDQFERKARNGHEAYEATDLPEDYGAHWRNYGRQLTNGGTDAVRSIYHTWFHDPPIELEHFPAPWRTNPK